MCWSCNFSVWVFTKYDFMRYTVFILYTRSKKCDTRFIFIEVLNHVGNYILSICGKTFTPVYKMQVNNKLFLLVTRNSYWQKINFTQIAPNYCHLHTCARYIFNVYYSLNLDAWLENLGPQLESCILDKFYREKNSRQALVLHRSGQDGLKIQHAFPPDSVMLHQVFIFFLLISFFC